VKNRADKSGNPYLDICAKFVGFKLKSSSQLFQSFIRLSYLNSVISVVGYTSYELGML